MKHEGKPAATMDQRTKGWQSTRYLVNGALADCPICGQSGPVARVDEHVRVDHPAPESETRIGGAGGAKALISLPCAALLDAMSARTGWTRGQLIEVVLRRAWGSHAPDR